VIYVFLPDVPVEPIGGIQTLFDYAERLNQLAHHTVATVVSPSTYVRNILPREYPLVPVVFQKPTLRPSDTLIIPEVLVGNIDVFPKEMKKFLAVLNWQYLEIFNKTPQKLLSSVTGILTNSEYSAQKLTEQYPSLPITHIPQVIEPRFHSTTPFDQRETRSILIMNRKNTHHITRVLSFLKHTSHRVTIINNIEPNKLIDLYNQHQIFINLGYPEGFCRPAAEAMACGCVVVGFTGGGGSDFMQNGVNSFTASDGNEEELLEQLDYILYKATPEQLSQVTAHAQHTIAAQYTPREQAKQLYMIFRDEVAKDYLSEDIEKMYEIKNVTHQKTKGEKHKNPLYATQATQESLELQLFREQEKYKEVTSSKFYMFWQKYCEMRDVIHQFLSHKAS